MSTAIGSPLTPPALPAPPDASLAASGGLEAADMLRVLKQRKLSIVLVFIAVYGLVVAGTLVLYLRFPEYRAEAVLELIPPADTAFQVLTRLADPRQVDLQVQSEARKLTQVNLLNNVLALPEVRATRFFGSFEGDVAKCLYELRDRLGATAIRDTTLIRVTFATGNAEDARTIVSSVINEYLKQTRIGESDSMREKVRGMQATRTTLNEQLETRRREIQAFRQRSEVPALEMQRDVTATNLAEINRELTNLETEATDYETQLGAMQGLQPWELPITPEMQLQVEADPVLRFRREQIEAAVIEIRSLEAAGLIGPNHRQMQLARARRDGYEEAARMRREELYDALRTQQVEALTQNLARVRAMQTRLLDQREELLARQRDIDANLQRFEAMVADRDRLETQLGDLDRLITDAEHASRSPQTSQRLELRSPAETPPRPSSPSLPLYLGGGFILAGMVSLGLAFVREFADTRVRTPIDVARFARLSVLGCIPALDDDEVDIEHIEHATRQAPRSIIAESFRQVRTNLQFSGPAEQQRTLLVTSPGAGCGKSSVAVNLAVVLAQSGQRVLLVDCNFRRPFVRGAFTGTRKEGLSNLLIGEGRLGELITKTDIPNLSVLSSGPLPPTPAELLGSTMMRDFLNEAAGQYDRIILDGPPVLLMSDALCLAVQVQGVILVARAAANSKGALRRAADQLVRIGSRVVGVVLNGVEARAGGYFRRQYREYYEYTTAETTPPELPGPGKPQA
jgi:succinoglycan biosynthesis transport protein ExoP